MKANWTSREENTLRELCGDMPWPAVVKCYQSWAKQHGYSNRSEASLRYQCYVLNVSRSTVGEWITTNAICQMLGISSHAVRRWITEKKYLPYKRFGEKGSHYYVRRTDLRKFARDRPYLFGGQSVTTLTQLLDSERLAEHIVAMNLPLPLSKPKSVRCVETGRRYPSISNAARATFVTPPVIRSALHNPHKTAGGFHWQIAV